MRISQLTHPGSELNRAFKLEEGSRLFAPLSAGWNGGQKKIETKTRAEPARCVDPADFLSADQQPSSHLQHL